MPPMLRATLALMFAGPVLAQTSNEPAAAPAERPPEPQRIEVTGGRPNETAERRASTAAKIVVGREEIERFGDTSVGDILRRLPGITVQGTPGRGGAPRMRGLGAGFTQILVDGERLPRGVSLDSITPEQIERIEILRAPTAETGARAIAGTINIVTRDGLRRHRNELRLGTGIESGQLQPGLHWSRNDRLGERLTYQLSLGAFEHRRTTHSNRHTQTADTEGAGGTVQRDEAFEREDARRGVNANARLQWRGEQGQALTLQPFLIYSESAWEQASTLAQLGGSAPYARSETEGTSRFALARLNGSWAQRLGAGRLEARGGLSEGGWSGQARREEFDADGALRRTLDDSTRTRDRNASLVLKFSQLLDDDHQLVAGAELERNRRMDTCSMQEDGRSMAGADCGDDLQASALRGALYAQDEWQLGPHWAAHAGLRGEAIRTRGSGLAEGGHLSTVWTPLLHAVWKPDPKGRDQVRFSLTRSYRSPALSQLIGRLRRNPAGNGPTTPDTAGNPQLRPELATGVDIAIERYLAEGGLLSVNLFQREIRDVMRTLTTLEPVEGGAARWVARPRNVGTASTRGVELEAKFRVTPWGAQGAPVDLRANASLFRSSVDGVPGPDNRLDQQPPGTLNLGADHRLRRLPLTLGASLNWTPGYSARLSEAQTLVTGRKRVLDAYALWTFNPAAQLRLSASNLLPEDQVSITTIDSGGVRETARTVTKSHVNLALRLELKL